MQSETKIRLCETHKSAPFIVAIYFKVYHDKNINICHCDVSGVAGPGWISQCLSHICRVLEQRCLRGKHSAPSAGLGPRHPIPPTITCPSPVSTDFYYLIQRYLTTAIFFLFIYHFLRTKWKIIKVQLSVTFQIKF